LQKTNLINQYRLNVLLEKRDGKLNSVICDFGLARVQHTKVIFFLLFI